MAKRNRLSGNQKRVRNVGRGLGMLWLRLERDWECLEEWRRWKRDEIRHDYHGRYVEGMVRALWY